MPSVSLHLESPASKVWHVAGERWGDAHRIIPSLSASRLLTEGALGPGSKRTCTLVEPFMGLESVEEQLVSWDEGRSFEYVFRNAPWPIESVSNRWLIEPDGEGTRLTMTPSLTMRGGAWTQWLAPAMLWLMSLSYKKGIPPMAEAIERECAALVTAEPGA